MRTGTKKVENAYTLKKGGCGMEISYNELKKKEVVNTVDGKKLGHICDLVFSCPENRVQGFVVPGGRAFGFRREEYFIDLKNVVKIGEDVILVNIGLPKKQGGKSTLTAQMPPPQPPPPTPRNYEEYE